MNLPPMPIPSPKLERGRYMVTENLVAQLVKIPGLPPAQGPILFPDEAGNIRNPEPWIVLPNGSVLGVYEDDADGGRLVAVHTNMDPRTVSATQYAADQLLLDKYLDG
jgi:hypothetical protein